MADKPDVQRRHVPVPPEKAPEEGGPARSHYDFHAEQGDSVKASHDPDGTWRWQLVGANGKLKLEAGNFGSRADAILGAHDAHGDVPKYEEA